MLIPDFLSDQKSPISDFVVYVYGVHVCLHVCGYI